MKYYINQDFRCRVFSNTVCDNKISRYYSFCNYVRRGERSCEATLREILEECEKENVDYLIYYYWQGFPSPDFYKQYRFREFLIFRELLEENR